MQKRKTSHFEKKEPVLESLLRYFRFNKIKPYILPNSNILDLGCGYNAYLLTKLSRHIGKGTGIDTSVTKLKIANNIRLIKGNVDKKLNFKKNSFDVVTCLATIEHVNKPKVLLNEVYRVLRPGGTLLITTPSIKNKPVLEFLANKFRLLSKDEIKDHKRYFDPTSLENELIRAGFTKQKTEIEYFQLGLNIFAKAQK